MTILGLEEIDTLIKEEEQQAEGVLYLTSNEAVLSPAAQDVLSSILYNRYLLENLDMRGNSPSRLGGFLFRGLNNVNRIEQSAHEVCKQLFNAEYSEFRCLSGLHAMLTTIVSLSQPDDKIMRFSVKDGGHFATEHLIKLLGRRDCCLAIDRSQFDFDIEKTREIIQRERPKLIYIDAMNYIFPFSIRKLRELAGDIPIIFDGSHTLGLIAGKQFPNPLDEGADILQANTHKTLFGPQKGLILSNNREMMDKINYNLSSGLVSSQHTSSVLSLFIALHEILAYGKKYSQEVIKNARYLAGKLHQKGFNILASDKGYTRIHQFYIDVTSLSSGPLVMQKLLQANIAVNRTVPFENVDAIRVGVQEITRRGYSEAELDQIAEWFEALILRDADPDKIGDEVAQLAWSKRGKILYCLQRKDFESNFQENKFKDGQVTSSLKRFAEVETRWIDCVKKSNICEVGEENYHDLVEIAKLAIEGEQQTDISGNISIKDEGRLFITVSGSHMKALQKKDFAEIYGKEKNALLYGGVSVPSSETYMHYLVYENTDARFVVHNHYLPTDEEIVEKGMILVEPKEIGSIQLAEAVGKAAAQGKVVFVRKHGLIIHGKTKHEVLDLLKGVMESSI